jgi:hypothetical protein
MFQEVWIGWDAQDHAARLPKISPIALRVWNAFSARAGSRASVSHFPV